MITTAKSGRIHKCGSPEPNHHCCGGCGAVGAVGTEEAYLQTQHQMKRVTTQKQISEIPLVKFTHMSVENGQNDNNVVPISQ